MKVLFIACRHSPYDHNAGSGKDYDLYHSLVRNGAEVEVVGPFELKPTLFERLALKAHEKLFKLRPAKYPSSFIRRAVHESQRAIERTQPEVIFSKYAVILHKLKTDIPIVNLTDTTLYGSHADWPLFSPLAYLRQNHWERKTYQIAAKIITHSQWAADTLTGYYHQPREKVEYFPVPGSIPASVVPEEITVPSLDVLKLLLVGRDRTRKGVDIAIETAELLNARGVRAELRVVGLDGENRGQIKYMGLYNKTIPKELAAYAGNYQWANFLIHPARFEAGGIVPGEAAAFGRPTITNNAGGLGTTVKDGISGIMLPKHSPAEAYAHALAKWAADPEGYAALCRRTRQRYDQELNWEAAGKVLYRIVAEAAGATPGGGRP